MHLLLKKLDPVFFEVFALVIINISLIKHILVIEKRPKLNNTGKELHTKGYWCFNFLKVLWLLQRFTRTKV